jgi:nucleoside-diphosphate-sugar epimerase
MRNGRVLITGGTGFVGRGLVASLAAAGVPMVLAQRRDVPDAPGQTHVTVGEIGRATEWGRALENVTAVVHQAGHVHIAPERAEHEAALFDEVNHLGSLRLFEAARDSGVPLFVFLSSINVLGTGTEPGRPFTDATLPDPTSPYARSKHLAEGALRAAAAGSSTRLVILRPPLIAGPGVGGNLERLIRLAALPAPLPLGRLTNRRSLLSRDNLLAAIARILDLGPAAPVGTFVLADRDPVSTSDIVAALRAGLGRAPMLLPVPTGLLRPALRALGARGADQRLFGDLEVDSRGFRAAFSWSDVVDTRTTLQATAAAR